MALCTGHSKQTGKPCKNHATPGFTVCGFHGSGFISRGRMGGRPIVHGRYSKLLPIRLQDSYKAAAKDPELLSIREQIATLDVRIRELLTKIDSQESGHCWKRIQGTLDAFLDAQQRGDQEASKEIFKEHMTLIKRGIGDYHVWREISELMQDQRKMIESERGRLVEMHQMISVERAMILITTVISSVTRNVTDKHALGTILAELRGLLNRPDPTAARPVIAEGVEPAQAES